jgi:uncharacterized protein (DUF488 family)
VTRATSPERRIFTIGHSTRSFDELVSLLERAGMQVLVDVRSVPRSRRHPQFERDALAQTLPAHCIEYAHQPALGGFRKPVPDSPNGGWEQPAFRGYADYMATGQFGEALEALQVRARENAACVMCAEAQWWRCHRRLIADALVTRGWEVLHLGLRGEPVRHELTSFAVVGVDGGLSYLPPQGQLPV